MLFIDEMNMHPVTRKKFTKSVNELLERALRDGDEAMIVRPTTAEKLVLKFTGDRAAIRAAVAEAMDAARFRADSPKQLEDRQFAIEMGAGGGDQRQVARRTAERVRRRIEQRLGNIRAIIASLAEEPGRKVLITVMEALPAKPGREFFIVARPDVEPAMFDMPGDHFRGDYVDLTPVITEIARIASSKGITVYALQPEFAYLTAPGTVETRADPTGGSGRPNVGITDQLDNTETSLNLLTEITGGKWFRGDTRVDDAFRLVALDVQSYYSLAYHGSGAIDQARKVQVRVKNHPELNVRTRSDVVRKSPRRELNDRVVAGLVYPPAHNGLGIALQEKAKERDGRRVAANVDVLVPLGSLTFTEDGGVHRARFTIHYAVAGDRTDFVSGIEPEQLVEIPEADWDKARTQHWRHSLKLNVRKGTPHRVAIGVLDSSSQEWGIESLTLAK